MTRVRKDVEKALCWSNPLHLPAVVTDEERALDAYVNHPLFPSLRKGEIKSTLIGDDRQIGLLFPKSFDSNRFIHPPIDILGVTKDLFESQCMQAVIKSSFYEPSTTGVILLGVTDLFTFRSQSPEADAWNIARAYKTLAKCIELILACSNSKILVLLPMALSNKDQLDLVAAQGQSLVRSVLLDTAIKDHVGSRIRFFSTVNFTYSAIPKQFGEFKLMYRLTRTGGYILTHEGSVEVSKMLASFISDWAFNQLPGSGLRFHDQDQTLANQLERNKIVYPFRPAAPLADAAERYELQNPTPRFRGNPKTQGSRSNRTPPPLMSPPIMARNTGKGKSLPRNHSHSRSGPYIPGPKNQPWAQRY